MRQYTWKAQAFIYVNLAVGTLVLAFNLSGLIYTFVETLFLLLLMVVSSLLTLFRVKSLNERNHFIAASMVMMFSYLILGLPACLLITSVTFFVEGLHEKYPWYVCAFNISTHALTLQFMHLVYQSMGGNLHVLNMQTILALLTAAASFDILNHLLVGVVTWLANGVDLFKAGMLDLTSLGIDYTLLMMGVTAALLYEMNPAAVIFSIFPIYMFYTAMKLPVVERKSELDAKTGVYNFHYFETILKREFDHSVRTQEPLTVVMGDLDHFRQVNNNYGHLAGDQILIQVAGILKNNLRNSDTLARFGGEEFIMLLPRTQAEKVFLRIEEIRRTIENTHFCVGEQGQTVRVTLSFGVATRSDRDETPKQFIENADTALYEAKAAGRNCTIIYVPL